VFNFQQMMGAAAVATGVFLNVQIANAGPIFDFNWSGDTLEAIGTIELSDEIDIGESFDDSHVVAIEIEFFDDGISQGLISFNPDVGFPEASPKENVVLEGMRTALGLSFTDFYIFDHNKSGERPFATNIIFGCVDVACMNGEVLLDLGESSGGFTVVDFESPENGLDSFIATNVPEPTTASVFVLGMGIIAYSRLRARRA